MLLKKILLITYHFPPSAASGAFRLLGFARHLPTFGWQPLVVAPPTMPWEPVDPRLVEQISSDTIVRSVPYPSGAPKLLRRFAQNAIWLPRAWSACNDAIRGHQPDVILTSGPPHCIHVLGHYLKSKTGLPWVADFRDPWISDGAERPLGWMQIWARRWERTVFQNADLILANAPNATQMFQAIYPDARARILTVTNGFDPDRETMVSARARYDRWSGIVSLLHAGEIYAGRDPLPLFEALAQVNAVGDRPCELEIVGRNDVNVDALLRERQWDGLVQIRGQRSYQESLDAMRQADILVLFDSPGRKMGVPAKLYEYFRAGRPILALAEPNGDVAAILKQSGVAHRLAPPKDTIRIQQALSELVQTLSVPDVLVDDSRLRSFMRENITGSLAHRLDALIGQPCFTLPGDPNTSPEVNEREVEA